MWEQRTTTRKNVKRRREPQSATKPSPTMEMAWRLPPQEEPRAMSAESPEEEAASGYKRRKPQPPQQTHALQSHVHQISSFTC